MATASTTYTFSGGTPAVAAQVNQNFTDLVNFLNTAVVHVDGSKTMSGLLNLSSTDPASANQATRKSYCDKQSLGGRPFIQTFSLDNGTAGTMSTVFDSGSLLTPTYNYTALCLVLGMSGFSAASNTSFWRVIDASANNINLFQDSGPAAVSVSQVAGNWYPLLLAGKYNGNSGQAVRWGAQTFVSGSNVYARAACLTLVMPR